MTDQQIASDIERIEAASGSARCTRDNPCGMVAHYDEGSDHPWRLADDWYSESYATAEEAIAAAKEWDDQGEIDHAATRQP